MWDLQDLFRRHNRGLVRFLRRRVSSPEVAADLTQELFLRLLTATPAAPVLDSRGYLYRHERKIRQQIKSLSDDEPDEDHNESARKKQIDELVQKVSDDAQRRLAEYTIKRHQIIQLARSLLKYSDDEKKGYHWERTLHELICPMGKMLSAKEYDEHNLWLIGDLLSYYSLFASDKTLSSLGVKGDTKEPM